jgi:NitT/TauT family transport system substrate-binding protein
VAERRLPKARVARSNRVSRSGSALARPLHTLRVRRGLATLLAFTLTACATPAASPASVAPSNPSSTQSAKPAPVTMRMALPTQSGDFIWVYVGKDAGIFADNGIDADVQYIASTQALTALIAGQVDVSLGAGSDVLSAAAGGADLVVVAVPSPTYPFIFEAAPGISTPNDLKGKKVGVSSIGSSSDVATRVALRKIGLDPEKDVNIVAVGSAEQRTAAALAGGIQGAVSLVPDNLLLEENGWKPLFNLADLKLPAVQNVVAFKRSFLASHRDLAQRFIDAMVLSIVREQKDRAFALDMLKKWSKIEDPKKAAATYDFYLKVHVPLPYPKVEYFGDSKTLLGATNDKVKAFDVATLLDDSLLKSAAERGVDKR